MVYYPNNTVYASVSFRLMKNHNKYGSFYEMFHCTINFGKNNKKWESQWVFGIYNVYARKNAASISFRQNDETLNNEAVKLSIFGIVPSVTYNFKF